jgi:hypothetical protein
LGHDDFDAHSVLLSSNSYRQIVADFFEITLPPMEADAARMRSAHKKVQ